MAMNREQRRYLQKQGQVDAEGNPVAAPREQRQAPTKPAERVGPMQFLSEIRSELKRVQWPTRTEVINYTTVVIITLIIMTALIALFDLAFGEAVLRLLDLNS